MQAADNWASGEPLQDGRQSDERGTSYGAKDDHDPWRNLPHERESRSDLLLETPYGRVPVRQIAEVHKADGPNQILRENSERRMVLANARTAPPT